MNRWVVSSQVLTQSDSIDIYIYILHTIAFLICPSARPFIQTGMYCKSKTCYPLHLIIPLTSKHGRMDEKTKNQKKSLHPPAPNYKK